MLTPELFEFLKELKENNNKEWFDKNRNRYKSLRDHFTNYVSLLVNELSAMDVNIGHPDPKKTIFRINRDIRFSKNKAPYKTNMGAFISGGGKKIALPGYYLHVEPGECMLAGGMYRPPSPELKMIRKEIFSNAEEFRNIIFKDNFRKMFGEMHGEKLLTAPMGFPKDHQDVELIRYKSYTVFRTVPDEFLTGPDSLPECMDIFRELKPLNDFLYRAVRPEEGSSSGIIVP